MSLTAELVAALVKIAVIVGTIMLVVPMLVWLERKLIADFQARIGPNRVGPFGLLQSFADGIKLLCKEDLLPSHVDRTLYYAAPIVMMIPALAVFAVVPFGSHVVLFGHDIPLVIADIPVGVLYILALTSLGVYGVVLSGWASNNKYSLLGGLRSSAQMVSYELPLGLAVVAGVLLASRKGADLSLTSIVAAQANGFWNWNVFAFFPLGFIAAMMYYIGGLAETNRAPFDLPEAETELIGGYHTEYGSMKWAMFFLAEYANMTNVAALLVTLFWGGWHSPIPIQLFPDGSIPSALGSIFWFVLKIFIVMVVYIWLRATLPRLRYDRLMGFTWKVMLPVALVNVLLIAAILTFRYSTAPARPTARPNAPVAAPAPPVEND